MPSGDVYSVQANQSSPGGNPLIEITAGSSYPLEILRVTVSQRDVATSQQIATKIARITSASTGGTTVDPAAVNTAAPTAGATAKHTLGTIGTVADILIYQGWNILAGFYYYPTEDERIIIPRSGIIAVYLQSAYAANYTTTVVFREL